MLLVLSVISSILVLASNAPPPIPTEYWGRLMINGAPAPDGTPVSYWNGNEWINTTTVDGYYSLILTGGDSDLTFNNDPTCAIHNAAGQACIPCTLNVDCVEGPQEGDSVNILVDNNPTPITWGDDASSDESAIFSMGLYSGYNLVSLPINPTDTSLPSALNSIQGKYKIVWGYKANENPQWKSYNPSLPDFFNNLKNMTPAYGYWVFINSTPATLSIAGKYVNPATFQNQLYEGYNLVGMPFIESKDYGLPNILNSILSHFKIVWGYKANENPQWKSYNPSLPDFFNNLKNASPYYGYWIFINQTDTLTLN